MSSRSRSRRTNDSSSRRPATRSATPGPVATTFGLEARDMAPIPCTAPVAAAEEVPARIMYIGALGQQNIKYANRCGSAAAGRSSVAESERSYWSLATTIRPASTTASAGGIRSGPADGRLSSLRTPGGCDGATDAYMDGHARAAVVPADLVNYAELLDPENYRRRVARKRLGAAADEMHSSVSSRGGAWGPSMGAMGLDDDVSTTRYFGSRRNVNRDPIEEEECRDARPKFALARLPHTAMVGQRNVQAKALRLSGAFPVSTFTSGRGAVSSAGTVISPGPAAYHVQSHFDTVAARAHTPAIHSSTMSDSLKPPRSSSSAAGRPSRTGTPAGPEGEGRSGSGHGGGVSPLLSGLRTHTFNTQLKAQQLQRERSSLFI